MKYKHTLIFYILFAFTRSRRDAFQFILEIQWKNDYFDKKYELSLIQIHNKCKKEKRNKKVKRNDTKNKNTRIREEKKTRFTVKLWKNILSRFSVQRWTKTTQFSCGMYRFIALLSVVTREWNKAIDLRMMNNKPNNNSNNNNDRPTDWWNLQKNVYNKRNANKHTDLYRDIAVSQ